MAMTKVTEVVELAVAAVDDDDDDDDERRLILMMVVVTETMKMTDVVQLNVGYCWC